MKHKMFGIALAVCMMLTSGGIQVAHAAPIITSDTVITSENATDVMRYLGLESSDVISCDTSEYKSYTVGELQEVLNSAKSFPQNDNLAEINTGTQNKGNGNLLRSSVKTLTYTSHGDGGYTFTATVSGKYSGKKWTGVGTIDAAIDSDSLLTVYKVTSNDLEATWTSSKITLGGSADISAYIGVGDLGLVETHSFTISPYKVWTASSYL